MTNRVEAKVDMKKQISDSLLNLIKVRDTDLYEHSIRVMNYAVGFALYHQYKRDRIKILKYASMLHDIGKLGISDTILNKPNKLTNDEYMIIKEHSRLGYETVKNIECFQAEAYIILHHHERIDGYGYPDGIGGDDIGDLCKIITVCDSFDAMTSNRVYKSKFSFNKALYELRRYSGTQFDKGIVEQFIKYVTCSSPFSFLLHEQEIDLFMELVVDMHEDKVYNLLK